MLCGASYERWFLDDSMAIARRWARSPMVPAMRALNSTDWSNHTMKTINKGHRQSNRWGLGPEACNGDAKISRINESI